MSTSKIKMLCLHGFGQNSSVFNKRLASFRSKIKNKFEFIIPQAPHKLPKKNENDASEEGAYAWYYYSEENRGEVKWNEMFDSISDINLLYGLSESIDFIKKILNEHPDIEYILGFSQGAGLLSLLCKLGIIDEKKKLIFVSGFYPLKYDTLSEKLRHKCIHVLGESDTIILPKFSEDLHKFFSNAVPLVRHDGEHVIPRIKITI